MRTVLLATLLLLLAGCSSTPTPPAQPAAAAAPAPTAEDAKVARMIAETRRLAAVGDPDAQYLLGDCYENGAGVPVDIPQALKWYRMAADQDDVKALVKVADFLREGAPGVPQDYVESLRLARRAAELGSAEAMADVATMLSDGHGAPRDIAAAAKLFEQAADRGSAYAAGRLGWIYEQGELGAVDYVAARHWYNQAAANGDDFAMRQIGVMYREGKGIAKDPVKAFEWLERAGREGDGWAQNELGRMLTAGEGIERDDEEAVTWFRLAAKNGQPFGDANLGYHYLNGLGVTKSFPEALDHLAAAARILDDGWVNATFAQTLTTAPVADRPALSAKLHAWASETELLNASGSLPEMCLAAFDIGKPGIRDEAGARALLAAMIAANRPQSQSAVAWHAFTGWDMPYDLPRARSAAAAVSDRTTSGELIAMIDSVAADTPAEQATAREALHRYADSGNTHAAGVLFERYREGTGEPVDEQAARKYLLIAYRTAPDPAAEADKLLRSVERKVRPQPSAEEIQRLIAAAPGRTSATVPPYPVFRTPPIFPLTLRISGLEGQAMIDFIVDQDGQPQNVHAIKSTHPLFAYAAEAAVRRWRFAPAKKDGHPVPTHMQVPIIFNLLPGDVVPAHPNLPLAP